MKPKEPKNQLGRMLQEWRNKENIPMRDLAAEIGIAHCSYARIEWGEATTPDNLIKVLAWLLKREP